MRTLKFDDAAKQAMFTDRIRGMKIADIAKKHGASLATVKRVCKQYYAALSAV